MLIHSYVVDPNLVVVVAGLSLTLLTLGGFAYRMSPVGKQTVDTLKDLLEVTKAELEATREQRASALEAVDLCRSDVETMRLKAGEEAHRLELLIKDRETEIVRLEQRATPEQFIVALQDLNAGFEQHRHDLLALLEKLAASNEKLEEGMASNTQALVLLVDRHRAKRETD